MPTFMSQRTFAHLRASRDRLVAEKATIGMSPSNVFVPWAGEQFIATGRGIYYVGLAANAEKAEGEQSFPARLQSTEQFCRDLIAEKRTSPYWNFLDRLSQALLGDTYTQTTKHWGWSNLLKVAGEKGAPGTWPSLLVTGQRQACIEAFHEEIGRLRESLIVVTSVNEFGVLYGTTSGDWDKQDSQIYRLFDKASGNAFVHCYHPNYMRRRKTFDQVVSKLVQLAQQALPPFV